MNDTSKKTNMGVMLIVGEDTGEADVFLDQSAAEAFWKEHNSEGLAEWLNQHPEIAREDGQPYDLDNDEDFDAAFQDWEAESMDPGAPLTQGALYLTEDIVRNLLRILILRWGNADMARLYSEAAKIAAEQSQRREQS